MLMQKIWGKVQKHNQRGKTLGFPTANINLHKNIPEGIYISKTKIDRKLYQSVTFIGIAKTFNEKRFHAETYILDFNHNIYDKWITVLLLKRIRGNKKFKSAKELVKQMRMDEKEARQFFAPLTKDISYGKLSSIK